MVPPLKRAPVAGEIPWLIYDAAVAPAPLGSDVIVVTRTGETFLARDTAAGWRATTDLHPPSWHGGRCWVSNEDGEPSDPVAYWAWPPVALRG